MKTRVREDAEGARDQRHRREDRHVLAARNVQRRAAAARGGVVHARQIVERERGGVDHLHRAGGIEEPAARRAEEIPREEHQPRPDPLSRGREGLACGLGERIERVGRGPPPAGQELRQPLVDGGLDLAEEAGESVGLQKLASASFSSEKTSKTVMSWVTVRTSLIFGGRFRSFSFAPLCVAVV